MEYSTRLVDTTEQHSRERSLRSHEFLQVELDPPQQPRSQAFAPVMYQVPHIETPHQIGEIALPDVCVDRRADGRDEAFVILARDIRTVVQAWNCDRIPLP